MCPLFLLVIEVIQTWSMFTRHVRHLWDWKSFRWFHDGKVAAITAWCLPLEYFPDLGLVKPEVELGIVVAQIYIFPAFRIFIQVIIWHREDFTPIQSQCF